MEIPRLANRSYGAGYLSLSQVFDANRHSCGLPSSIFRYSTNQHRMAGSASRSCSESSSASLSPRS